MLLLFNKDLPSRINSMMRKPSIFTNPIRQINLQIFSILKLLNQRKLETLKERWWNQNPQKVVCDDDDDSGGGISIYNIGGVFIVIFVGIGLAIITLVIEYWYYKYKKPASRVDSSNKKFQVKQAMQGGTFSDRKDYGTEYRFVT